MKILAVVLFFLFSAAVNAQTQAIVPFPPGGALDALARTRTLGIEPAPAMSSEEGIRWIAAEHDKWAKLIREKGIRAE